MPQRLLATAPSLPTYLLPAWLHDWERDFALGTRAVLQLIPRKSSSQTRQVQPIVAFVTKAQCHLVCVLGGGGKEASELPLLLGSCPSGNFGPPSLGTEGQRHRVPISTAQEISVIRPLGKRETG